MSADLLMSEGSRKMRFHGMLYKTAMMALTLAIALAAPSSGSTIYVDANAPGLNMGTSWVYAYNYLQDALSVAQPGDTIKVAQGTYRPTDGLINPQTGQEATFELLTGVTIMGGYYGNALTASIDSDTRDTTLYPSILSGDINSNDQAIEDINDVNDWDIIEELPNMLDRQDNAITVVTGYDTEPNAVLDGFTITGGIGDVNSADPWPSLAARGAGLDLYWSDATIQNCTFLLNSAPGRGGALFAYNSDPNLLNCNFVGNYSEEEAGALYLHGSDAYVQNCNFTYNAVDSGEAGGAAYCQSSDATFDNCLFEGNYGGRQSGAIQNNNSDPEFFNCSFTNNKCKYQGGAIRNSTNSWPYFENCQFMHNYSVQTGGAIDNSSAAPTFVNCIFTDNQADQEGGAISSQSTDCLLINCLFNRNISEVAGGAISNMDTLMTIINNTFYYNVAPSGAGIACVRLSSSTAYPSEVAIANTILWDGGDEIYNENSSVVDINYSDVQGGWVGTGNIYAYPNFQDNDGSDNIAGNADDDLSLKAASPCIDAGNNLPIPLEILTDLAGNSRQMDSLTISDTGNGTAPIVDIGAYEYPGEGGSVDHAPVADAGSDQTVQITSGDTAFVTLDGSGSYDLDGDTLNYIWSWVDGEGSPQSAMSVNPTIELSEGEYTIQLVVYDGTYISEIDTVTITVEEEMTVQVTFIPSSIDRSNPTSSYFMAIVRLVGIDESELNTSAGLWIVPANIQSILTVANSDSSGTTITSFFSLQEVLNAISSNGSISLTVQGYTNAGGVYSGTGTVTITP